MKLKKLCIMLGVAFILSLIIYFLINFFKKPEIKEEPKEEPQEKIDIIAIDYDAYQKLRSEAHNNETFAIIIIDDNTASTTFRQEVLYSFEGRSSNVYEIKYNELTEEEKSGIISDISTLKKYNPPEIKIPTMLVSQNGKIVYIQELLAYSPDIKANLDKNKIE